MRLQSNRTISSASKVESPGASRDPDVYYANPGRPDECSFRPSPPQESYVLSPFVAYPPYNDQFKVGQCSSRLSMPPRKGLPAVSTRFTIHDCPPLPTRPLPSTKCPPHGHPPLPFIGPPSCHAPPPQGHACPPATLLAQRLARIPTNLPVLNLFPGVWARSSPDRFPTVTPRSPPGDSPVVLLRSPPDDLTDVPPRSPSMIFPSSRHVPLPKTCPLLRSAAPRVS